MNAIMMYVLAIIFTFPTLSRSAPLFSNTAAARQDGKGAELKVDPRLLFCNTNRFQAAFKGPDNKQYYFRSYEVFVVNKNNVKKFPRKEIFPESPYFVNAMVYSQQTGKAYLFKDRKVWIYKYHGNEFIYLQTKHLGRTSPNIIEAAFFYQGFIYLLKDGYLYAWDEQNYNVIPNHVFPIHYFWKDVPKKVDAVMQYEDSSKTLFWKWQPIIKMQYYLFDNLARKNIKSGSFVSFFPFCAR